MLKYIFTLLVLCGCSFTSHGQLTSVTELDEIRASCMAKFPVLSSILTPLDPENEYDSEILGNDMFLRKKEKVDGVGSDHLNRLASLSNSRWYYYECVAIWLNKKHNLNLKIRPHFEKRSAVACQFIEGLNKH